MTAPVLPPVLKVVSPIDGSIYVERPLATARDVDEALSEARSAQASWKLMTLEQRRSEEHTTQLQSLMRISYAVLRLNKKNAASLGLLLDVDSKAACPLIEDAMRGQLTMLL